MCAGKLLEWKTKPISGRHVQKLKFIGHEEVPIQRRPKFLIGIRKNGTQCQVALWMKRGEEVKLMVFEQEIKKQAAYALLRSQKVNVCVVRARTGNLHAALDFKDGMYNLHLYTCGSCEGALSLF